MSSDLALGLVRILKPDSTTAGAGFVVTDDGLFATRAHVVANVAAGPGEAVHIIFHHTGDEATTTRRWGGQVQCRLIHAAAALGRQKIHHALEDGRKA